MSRVVVPIHLGNLAAIPTGTDIGFKQLYLRTNWVKLYNGVSEQDLVLDRPLDNFTPLTGSITAADSVLTALEKLQYSVSLLANSISEAPNDGAQYVRKNQAWDKLTSYSTVNPVSTDNIAGGYPLGSDWYNTTTGEKFYQKANGIWISYTSSVTPPTPGGDSPVMFADYATDNALPSSTYYNGPLNDGTGATITCNTNGKLKGIVGGAQAPMLVGMTLLVKNETIGDIDLLIPENRPYNGVYVVTQEGCGPTDYLSGCTLAPWVLTRVDYADEYDELFPSQVNILSGTNQNRFFLQQNNINDVGLDNIEYEINYVPPTQVVTMPLIHMDTATSAPLPSCTYVDEYAPPIPGSYIPYAPIMSYLTATVNGPLGVINGVNMSVLFSAARNRKILVKNQADPVQNGDYEVVQIGSATQPWKLRRITTNYSSFDKNTREWKINNEACTLYGNRYYMNYISGFLGTIGNDPITFSELAAGGAQNLQEVTDIGNTTTNNVQFGTGAGVFMDNGSRLKEGTIDAGYGGSKGIAQICAVGYELKWEAGRLYVMGDGGTTIREVSHNFATTPTITDDIAKGFIVGSRWILDNGTLYVCYDATAGAAVWVLQTVGNQDLQSVTNNGAITTNTITVGDIAGNFSQVLNSAIGTENAVTGTYAYLDASGFLGLHNGDFESDLKNTNVTNAGVVLEFPNKTTGSYTIATTADIPTTPSLQDVIDVNKVADRVEFKHVPFKGSAFTGGYDYLIDFTESNQDDGVYIYGDFAQYGTGTGQDIVKINSDGTTDASFNVGTGFNNYPYTGSGKLAQTAAGKLYVSGSFTTYNGTTANRIIRLNTDGSIDGSFVTGSGFYGGLNYTNSIGLDSLERVYVAGGCTNYNGASITTFVRLLSNGTLDTSFVTGSGFSNTTTAVLVNSDDTLFVGGHFTTYKGVSSPRFVKLLSNGDIDTSFVVGAGFNDIVTNIVKTLDNKIIVTGHFTTYQGVSANRIIKLNLDGSRDTSFNIGTGFSSNGSYSLKILLDGKLLIRNSGSYNGMTITGMLIIDTNGNATLNSQHSFTGYTQLSDGRFIGMSNTAPTDNYLVQIVNGAPIKDQKLTFSEITGKAEYTIDTLDGTTTYELLPKHLIQNLITESIPVVPTPTLQEVTYAGNVTTDVIISSLGFETTLFGTTNQMAFVGITSINNSGIITYKGLLSLQAGSLDGTGFMSNLTSDNLTQDRFLKLPNKTGTLAITTDIPAAQVNSNWNATSGVAQILNKPLIPVVDSVPTYGSPNAAMSGGVFDALALKADLVAGKVPSSQLPSYVDDVIEGYYSAPTFYSNAGLTTPIVPETGKIYVDLLGNKSYRWSGSVYIQISNAISSIDELTDVTITSPLNGQLLQYNLTTSQWENKTVTVGNGDMQKSTYDIDNDGIVDFAETIPVTVRNPSVSDILRKGTIVYLSGSTGYRPNAYKAQANAESTSSGTFGVVLADIATNTDGSIAMLGTIHTLDTRNAATGAPYPFTNDILADGDILWLDPANAGYVTKTKPQAPNHIVFIGVVARSHPSLGRIVYRITNGYELDELHNVFINGTLANKHTLYYDAATSLWKTNTIAGVLGFTPQAQLSSGVNIKTISGNNLLGSGNIDTYLSSNIDTNISTPADGEVLTWNAATNKWVSLPPQISSNGNNQLLTGGASWSGTGMVYNVTALTYIIDGTNYGPTTPANVTLSNGDPSFSRFDAIVVDVTGIPSVIIGTASSNPTTPIISENYVLVQYVLVGAAATTPTITNEYVYRDGSAPDWTTVTAAGTAPVLTSSFVSTTPVSFQGSQCTLVNAPSYTSSKYIQYTKPSGSILRSTFSFLTFRVNLPVALPTRNVYVYLYNGTTFIGAQYATNWGLNLTSVNNWQLVSIPTSIFGNASITTITKVIFRFTGTALNTFSSGYDQFAIDDIKFQSGYGPQANTANIVIASNNIVTGSAPKLNFINGTDIDTSSTYDNLNNKIDIRTDASINVTNATKLTLMYNT